MPPKPFPYWTIDQWNVGHPDKDDYFWVKRPDAPGATYKGWQRRSYVMWWIVTGKAVPKGYDLHHIDENRRNDVFGNLELIEHETHARRHRTGPVPEHGTHNRFWQGCRCVPCTMAHRAYMKKYQT